MKRFTRLEFDAPSASGPPAVREAYVPDHDQHHWLKAAGDERRKGMHEDALRLYSRALELDRSLVAGWAGQVRMLIALGEYPEAELWSRKALELFKNNPDLLAGRAQALCRLGDLHHAQASSDAAIAQPGLGSYPWLARGEIALSRKERAAEHCFDKATQLDADWLLLLEIGDVFLHHKMPTKALMRIRRAVEAAPDSVHAWFRQGQCEALLGLQRPAERSFQQCLQLVPRHVPASRALFNLSNGGRIRGLLRRFVGR